MVRWLGERLTIGQFVSVTAPRVAQGAPAGSQVVSDQFNAMPGILSWWSTVFAFFGRGAPASEGDQRQSGTAAPAKERAVTPMPKARRFAAAPRPRVLTAAR